MISFLLAMAAIQAPAAADQAKACADLVRTAPDRAVQTANEWRLQGGGLLARECLALAYVELERWPAAAVEFEQAALEAEAKRDVVSAQYWAQSGNAWLADGDPVKARRALDAALATSGMMPELRGEALFDRARAFVEQGDVQTARADIDKGLALVPADPFGWYLSAALARRAKDLVRAKADIAKATELAPNDADILLEAGNIAGLSGDADIARAFYARAAKAAPDSPAGRAAGAALAADQETGPPE